MQVQERSRPMPTRSNYRALAKVNTELYRLLLAGILEQVKDLCPELTKPKDRLIAKRVRKGSYRAEIALPAGTFTWKGLAEHHLQAAYFAWSAYLRERRMEG